MNVNQPDADSPLATPAWPLIVFELALGGLGMLIAGIAGFWKPRTLATWGMPYTTDSLASTAEAIGWGLVATLPLLTGIFVLRWLPFAALREFEEWIDEQLAPLFEGRTRLQIVAIAFAAGWGEETLFRWTIQTGFSERFPGLAGLVLGITAASIVFGLMHAATRLYAVFAALISVYLGLVLIWTGSLLAVVITHAVYDWVVVENLRYRLAQRRLRNQH